MVVDLFHPRATNMIERFLNLAIVVDLDALVNK